MIHSYMTSLLWTLDNSALLVLTSTNLILLIFPPSVLKAHKFLPAGGTQLIYKTRCNLLKEIIASKQKELPYINLKSFYQHTLGGTLSIMEKEDSQGNISYTTLPCFNPILMLYVYEYVSDRVWERINLIPKDNQVAMRIDAVSYTNYKEGYQQPGFIRDETKSVTAFYPNPRLKDKDINRKATYLDAVKESIETGTPPKYTSKGRLSKLILTKEFQEDFTIDNLGRYINFILPLSGEVKIPVDGYRKLTSKEVLEGVTLRDPTVPEAMKLKEYEVVTFE